jgi:saccharopine dehydrogenase (NAD+, L-lysine-forming)
LQIAIRRENKGKYERRAPLTPANVQQLREAGHRVLVEKAEQRIFGDSEYAAAGAEVTDNISEADIILGVKEIPEDLLIAGKTYFNFAHVIKGQKHNMPTLQRMMDLDITLIDYEKISNRNGQRTVFFGPFAGLAGMLDGLWGLGQRFALQGYKTPLAEIRQTLAYDDLHAAMVALQDVAKGIRTGGFPKALAPVVIGVTGYGNVARGAMRILDQLPIVDIGIEALLAGVAEEERRHDCLYRVVFTSAMTYARRDGSAFDKFHFFANPEQYQSILAPAWRRLTMLVNAVYWSDRAERMLSRAEAIADAGRLQFITDISCDIRGGIELTDRATNQEAPFLHYSTSSDQFNSGLADDGINILAVDNLPCELPRDASVFFGRALLPLLLDYNEPQSESQAILEAATILDRGKLTPAYAYLEEFLDQQ